ncbi:hypothetical protein BZB76_1117 [Actinomadura pelletieri DSM 43383]|uniref:Uncharacterized protein n=1 Tax=Actinomadura pelletieri DSM 43383 TaxID=1120940 RepID=A0A495R038_9ACTN|nr:hypothetical protein [Actinomadura pelletieri]RKS79642.1 hypothetical protein BZB76_1117 [Actinomadura pelletieri DSM 43383]
MTPKAGRAAVLDLDETTLTLVDGDDRAYRRPSDPPGPFDRPVIVVSAPHGPGAAELESLHRVAPYGVRGTGRYTVCAAAAARRGLTGTLAICDITWSAARVARAETRDAEITVGPHRDLAGLGGGSFVAGLTTDPAQRAALREALTGDPDFLLEACDQAVQDPMFRDVPLMTTSDPTITVGRLLDALPTYLAALTPLVADLGSTDHTVLTGAFTAFPLLTRALADAAGRPPLVLPDAVLEGALLLAEGTYTEPDAPRANVRIPLHRHRAGLLEERLVALPYGVGEYALLDGADLHITKGGTGDGLPITNELPLEVDGVQLNVNVAHLPTGNYRLGVRTDRDRPPLLVATSADDDTEPRFIPLPDRSAQK